MCIVCVEHRQKLCLPTGVYSLLVLRRWYYFWGEHVQMIARM